MSIYRIFETVPHADGRILLPLLWHGPFLWTSRDHWRISGRTFCSVVTRHLADSPVLGCGCCRAMCASPGVAMSGCLACLDRLSLRAVSVRFRAIVRRIFAAQDSAELSCACTRPLHEGPATCAENNRTRALSVWSPRKSVRCQFNEFMNTRLVCPRFVCSVEWTHCYARERDGYYRHHLRGASRQREWLQTIQGNAFDQKQGDATTDVGGGAAPSASSTDDVQFDDESDVTKQWWFNSAFLGEADRLEVSVNVSPVYRFPGAKRDITVDEQACEALHADLLEVDTAIAHAERLVPSTDGPENRGPRYGGWKMKRRRTKPVTVQQDEYLDSLQVWRENRPRHERGFTRSWAWL